MPAPVELSPKSHRRLAFRPSRARQPHPPRDANAHPRPPAPPGPQPPRGDDREIESWLSDLRGRAQRPPGDPRGTAPAPPSKPSADQTRAMQIPREQPSGQQPHRTGGRHHRASPPPPRDEKDPDDRHREIERSRRERTDPRQRRGRRAQRCRICYAAKAASSARIRFRLLAFGLQLIRFGLHDRRFVVGLARPRRPDPWPTAPGTRC